MLNYFRHIRHISLVLVFAILFQVCFPTFSYALTSGPAQPEFSSFEPVGTTQMVDLFSGDFTYNIPLFELPGPEGGYPFNLAYHSGRTMEEEASWVGLGWSLNHGAITRQMRGLPDDFDGEEIIQTIDMKPDVTWSGRAKYKQELLAFELDKLGHEVQNSSVALNLSLGVSHNSYKGWGTTFNIGADNNRASSGVFNWGVGFSAGSHEAASIQVSAGLHNLHLGPLSLGSSVQTEIDSREGLKSVNLGSPNQLSKDRVGSIRSNPSFPLFSRHKAAYIPTVGMNFRSSSVSRNVELGKYLTHRYSGGALDLNRTGRRLAGKSGDSPVEIKNLGYGYFYQKNITENETAILDFNRELDGTIRPTTPNLPIPQMTQDLYSVMGQGTGGIYQAFRSDVGVLGDPAARSVTGGGTLGAETNLGSGAKPGINAGGDWGSEESHIWNTSKGKYGFSQGTTNSLSEQFYFKSASEMTAEPLNLTDYIGGDKAAAFVLDKEKMHPRKNNIDLKQNILKKSDGQVVSVPEGKRKARSPRSMAIQSYTNKEILNQNNEELIGLFDVKIYNGDIRTELQELPGEPLDRSGFNKSHIAGFTSLEKNGMRYVYGLPVYNNEHREYRFSVNPSNAGSNNTSKLVDLEIESNNTIKYKYDETNKYFEKKEIPPYVHTYLLTSVVGADYVDADDVPGPSNGDKGYWVKFNYKKTHDSFKWRAPFEFNSTFRQVGTRADKNDDISVYSYGEREQYFLASAETRTHIAYFDLDAIGRNDGRSVKHDFFRAPSSYSNVGDKNIRLDNIKLFTKDNRNPKAIKTTGAAEHVLLKTINFGYNHSLCPEVENNIESSSGENGKLTLKTVSFQYEDSNRGALSPYMFEYNTSNPTYSVNQVDRWGTYLKTNTNYNIEDFPYTPQNNRGEVDEMASAWHLSKIITPSGAEINLEYEADDYAYVQDRTAMQMLQITGIGTVGNNAVNVKKNPTAIDRRIYFEPKAGIALGSRADVKAYLDDIHGIQFDDVGNIINQGENQLLFRIGSILFSGDSDGEDVRGYSIIEDYGFDGSNPFIVLGTMSAGDLAYHPFCAVAWQVIKESYGDRLNSSTITDDGSFKDGFNSFIGSFATIGDFFRGYYSSCSKDGFANKVELGRSFIRLCSPDKKKFGGGIRVKQVSLDDKWTATPTTYGQVFDYTKEEDGKTISSGVATNEPAIAYEECALRYGRFFTHEARHVSTDYLTLEYPLNASYFPGASVGYSNVTVKSLATHYADATNRPSGMDLPLGFGTTGSTVHEYYTAQDFPILVQETDVETVIGKPWIRSGIVNIQQDYYAGSQGYSIELNDMHGKPRKITTYGSDKTGMDNSNPISSVEYEYLEGSSQVYTSAGKKKSAKTLLNTVSVLKEFDPSSSGPLLEEMELGVDYEFFSDFREYKSKKTNMFVGFNLISDPTAGFPIPLAVPQTTIYKAHTKTAVTNKIIRKHGILKAIKAYDGQSTIVTTNEVFDPLTGNAVLTSVNNMYDDKVYNLNVPARYAYDGMDAAYKNIGLTISVTLSENQTSCAGNYYFDKNNIGNEIFSTLCEGDEFIVTQGSDEHPITTARLVRKTDAKAFVTADADVSLVGGAKLKVTRSGRKNLLSAPGASIVTLKSNPLENWLPIDSWESTTNAPSPNGTHPFAVVAHKINNVLSASAVTYDDSWVLDGKCSDCFTGGGTQQSSAGDGCDLNCVIVSHLNPNEELLSGEIRCGITAPQISLEIKLANGQPFTLTGPNSVPAGLPSDWYSNNSYVSSPWFCTSENIESATAIESGDCESSLGNFYNIQLTESILSSFSTYKTMECVLYKYNNSLSCVTADADEIGQTRIMLANGVELLNLFGDDITAGGMYNQISSVPTTILSSLCGANSNFHYCAPFFCSEIPISDVEITEHGICEENVASNLHFISDFVEKVQISVPCSGTPQPPDPTPFNCDRYANGSKGIWRPHKTYTYLKDRKSSANIATNSGSVNLKNDGVFDEMPIFNWKNPWFVHSLVGQDWRQTSEITKYNEHSDELENRDILGRYQAALYGYENTLSTAVAGNARYNEIAFQSFEEFTLPKGSIKEHIGSMSGKGNSDNFSFAPSGSQQVSESFNIVGYYEPGQDVYIDKSFSSWTGDYDYAILDVKNAQGEKYEVFASISNATELVSTDVHFLNFFPQENITKFRPTLFSNCLPTDKFAGRITLVKCAGNQGLNGVYISKEKAHSGDRSLYLTYSGQLGLSKMSFDPEKMYTISAWVHVPNMDVHTFAGDLMGLGIGNGSFQPSGPIIDGWQRIEGDFKMGTKVPMLNISVKSSLYLDDIRIQPKNSVMQAYAYDPSTFRLVTALDENNYATFYQYDEEGNLFQVSRETERGIKTVQENQDFTKH